MKPETFKIAIIKLLCLKSIITMAVTGMLCYLTFDGQISTDNFQTIAVMVFTYYFTRQSKEKEQIKNVEEIL